MNSILLALLPLIGVALGALFQASRESRTQKRAIKIKAYSDYLQAASMLSGKDASKYNEARILLTDAKLRITIYGSAEVIKQIATFDRLGSVMDYPNGMKSFLRIISAMRKEGQNLARHEDLSQLVFGRDIK